MKCESVIQLFEEEGYSKYDPKYLLPFLQGISDTYLHNNVMLSDGREGEIIMTNKVQVSRPVVMIDNDFVDLSKHSELSIIAIL